MGKFKKRHEDDFFLAVLDLIKRLIQWAHYTGGVGLVLIMIGCLAGCFDLIYGIIIRDLYWPVFLIALCFIGLGIFLMSRKK